MEKVSKNNRVTITVHLDTDSLKALLTANAVSPESTRTGTPQNQTPRCSLALSFPPLILESKQRLLPKTGSTGGEERGAGLADGEFERCSAALALFAGAQYLIERIDRHGLAE
jgi:hypothetical protein